MFTSNFTVLLIARILPAFLHPVYVSMAFTVAAASVSKEQAPKAVSKVFVGVSAGMVLGVPVTSFIASEVSFSMAMLFFTVVNALVFVATILFIPSMPVKEKVSYGAQLSVLKKTTMWYSIIAVTLINGAMFGFFSYMSDYLKKVTEVSYNVISAVLLVYGLANIVGNVMAGKLLSINARRSIILMPFALLVSYICLFIVGEWIGAMVIVILILGVLAGIASNNMQYMITDAAPEAPEETKPKSAYDFEFDMEAIKADCIDIGKGMGLHLDTSLTPSNATWWNPVTASQSNQGTKLKQDLESYIKFHTVENLGSYGIDEITDFNIYYEARGNGVYSVYFLFA